MKIRLDGKQGNDLANACRLYAEDLRRCGASAKETGGYMGTLERDFADRATFLEMLANDLDNRTAIVIRPEG